MKRLTHCGKFVPSHCPVESSEDSNISCHQGVTFEGPRAVVKTRTAGWGLDSFILRTLDFVKKHDERMEVPDVN